MKTVNASLWDGAALLLDGVSVEFADDLRSGSFAVPFGKRFNPGRYVTVKADDGRTCEVIASGLPWDVMSGAPWQFTFITREGQQLS